LFSNLFLFSHPLSPSQSSAKPSQKVLETSCISGCLDMCRRPVTTSWSSSSVRSIIRSPSHKALKRRRFCFYRPQQTSSRPIISIRGKFLFSLTSCYCLFVYLMLFSNLFSFSPSLTLSIFDNTLPEKAQDFVDYLRMSWNVSPTSDNDVIIFMQSIFCLCRSQRTSSRKVNECLKGWRSCQVTGTDARDDQRGNKVVRSKTGSMGAQHSAVLDHRDHRRTCLLITSVYFCPKQDNIQKKTRAREIDQRRQATLQRKPAEMIDNCEVLIASSESSTSSKTSILLYCSFIIISKFPNKICSYHLISSSNLYPLWKREIKWKNREFRGNLFWERNPVIPWQLCVPGSQDCDCETCLVSRRSPPERIPSGSDLNLTQVWDMRALLQSYT